MSKMPEYDTTAGFPPTHVEAFKRVAKGLKVVIVSRELNPLCTDLVLESYASKGFHIKAKTCDWGPMAGFVLQDPRFTKGTRAGPEGQRSQKKDIEKAFVHGARYVPLFISDARFQKLAERRVLQVRSSRPGWAEVSAQPETGGLTFSFILVWHAGAIPGAGGPMWGVYYGPNETPQQEGGNRLSIQVPAEPGMTPVMGMVNPHDSHGRLGVKSAVTGDYDLFAIYQLEGAPDLGLSERPMQLRATMPKNVSISPEIRRRAAMAGLIFGSGEEKARLANLLENPNMGNISQGILKIKSLLNQECKGAGYKGGNMVHHSDWTGNPFADLDWPIIAFIPVPQRPRGQSRDMAFVEHRVIRNINKFRVFLQDIQKLAYVVRLNPSWWVRSFQIDPTRRARRWQPVRPPKLVR